MAKLTIDGALSILEKTPDSYVRLLEQPAFDVGMYRPEGMDRQTPHQRDELYIIAKGSGIFVCGEETETFGPGDVLFAPAGVKHRFADFSDGFAAWVIFVGKRA